MKRDIAVFLMCVVTVVTFCVAGIRKISPAFSTEIVSNQHTLVLDAGHGGVDGGATTPAGNKESDINLSIVLKMEALCSFIGIETVLTRREDISIYSGNCKTIREKKVSDLKNRVSLVENTPNAMLISVHQNTFTDPRYQGSQVFFGSNEFSRQWGEYTQNALRMALNPDNVRKSVSVPDHVYLFKHISCPAILVECGFLSNAEDAALLLTDSYQRKIAITLIDAYIHQLTMFPRIFGGD